MTVVGVDSAAVFLFGAKVKNWKKMEKKLSNVVKPESMTAEEWQKELRRQFVEREPLSITPDADEAAYGVFDVKNPKTKNSYKVVYRGIDSKWNYCSCMDFKTNRLGTCKHVEAVRKWLESHHKNAAVVNPPYSSLYVSYKEGREVCLRIGSSHWAEMKVLAAEWFTEDGKALPGTLTRMPVFIAKAKEIEPEFRCYPDVTDYLSEIKDAQYRERYLSSMADKNMDSLLKTTLYPYQKEGIRFAFSKGKSIIADEMGLGKTVQAIGCAELMRKAGLISSVLVLCPASLKYQWKKEIEKFTDSVAVIVEGPQDKRRELYRSQSFYRIVSYNTMSNDIRTFGNAYAECLIMDEVQRLKNWNTQISRAARKIKSDYTIVLSGTPLENKLVELYSVMEFVDQYCLGPYYKFIDETTVKDEGGKILSYKNLNLVGERLAKRLVRRRKADIELQLPERTQQNLFVPMTSRQREIHDELKAGVAQIVSKWRRSHFLSDVDRKRLMLLLSQMRMVCDSTYILDQETRFDTKVEETMNIVQEVVESGDDKIVIFSQWERMTRLIATELEKLGVGYASLNGKVPSEKRNALVEKFWNEPSCRVFISTDTGSTGLNLQIASRVINLDLPWNPSVLEQRVGRVHRIGQRRNIQVLNMISQDSFEERMLATLEVKASLFEGILDNGDDTVVLDDSRMNNILKAVADYVGEGTDSPDNLSAVMPVGPEDADNEMANVPEESPAAEDRETDCRELLKRGSDLLSDLSAVLKSPEKTAELLDAIVHTDAETGKSELRIPVPDKDAVATILSSLLGLLR